MITCQVCDGGDDHGYMWHGRVVCEHCQQLGRKLEQASPSEVRAVRILTILTLERMQVRGEGDWRERPALRIPPQPARTEIPDDRGW